MGRKTYIGFFADPDLKDSLQRLANLNDRTMSQELRSMIKERARKMEMEDGRNYKVRHK